jgi:HD-like signal output (HDOD) protein
VELIIPSRPELLMEVQALLEQDADPAELAELVKRDVALYTILLSIVNSPLFRRSCLIESVEHAITILGIKRVAALIENVAVRTTLDPDGTWQRFWEVAAEVATLCYRLSKELNYPNHNAAYSLGMMHDIGAGVMRENFSDYEEKLTGTHTCNAVVVLKTEKAHFGIDRYTVAGDLAQRWFMSPELCDAIRMQAHAQASLMGRAEVPEHVIASNALLILAKDISHEYDAYWNFDSLDSMGGLVQKSIEYFGVDRNQYVDMKEDMIYQLAKEAC